MIIGLIGNGAIAQHVQKYIAGSGHDLGAILMREGRRNLYSNPRFVFSTNDLPEDIDLMVDCAGHAALATYGLDILRGGTDLVTVSLGALADQAVHDRLRDAAQRGRSRLHLASGAIGALDCLQAARTGRLDAVRYVGRKPPRGWVGSPAEDVLDLAALKEGAKVHFQGTARDAAMSYPKNANVAAAVALAGLGFDATQVTLIADADVSENIHEVEATGDFGSFRFRISGKALPDNPRSSALAAMSVVSKIEHLSSPIRI